jgi:hypothetical protein
MTDFNEEMKQFKTHSQTGDAKIELFINTYKFTAQFFMEIFYLQ